MKKIISVLALSAIVTTTVFSGCNIRVNINENTPTKPTQATTSKTEETTSNTQETVAVENTYETIPAPKPIAFDREGLELLFNEGYTENDLRKKYTFNDKDINCDANKKYVLDRMCNSVDFFTTLQASYTETKNNNTTWVSYAVDQRVNKAKELVYSIPANKKQCFPLRYVYADGDYHVKLIFTDEFKTKHTYSFTDSLEKSNQDLLKNIKPLIDKPLANEFGQDIEATLNSTAVDNTYFTDYIHYIQVPKRTGYMESHGMELPLMIRRGDNNIGLITAYDHYLPQYIGLEALCNNPNWEITKLESQPNREIIHIAGNYYHQTFEYERNIELAIEKNTGIILSCKQYNTSGKLVEEINCVELIINSDIDESIFDTIDPKDIVDSKQQ